MILTDEKEVIIEELPDLNGKIAEHNKRLAEITEMLNLYER